MGQLGSDELLDVNTPVFNAGGGIVVAPLATIDPGVPVDIVTAGFEMVVDSVPVFSVSSAWACSAVAMAASGDRLLLILLPVCCWSWRTTLLAFDHVQWVVQCPI